MNMATKEGKLWMNGTMIEQPDAKIHVLTHSMHYGIAVFEGVRAYQTADNRTAIFRLKEHTERLLGSAKIFQMDVPFDAATLEQAHKDVVKQNNLAEAYIRPLIWFGAEKLGLSSRDNSVNAMVAAWHWGAYLGEEGIKNGIRVKTSSYTHHLPNVTMCKAKASSNYPVSIMANQEVTRNGYDEAILMDPQGYVCQGAGENLFLVKDGVLHTPDLAGGALDGITRRTIVQFAEDLGIKVVERRITRDEFYLADEIFMTGTAAEVTPIREYDDRTIGNGGRGPLTEKLQTLYFDVVHGRNEQYMDWLSFID
ncbi:MULTISPECIES: branched-chain amino acid transaminase [Psychrobacter]|jgi:branched-chain amino acid aminotransferase|uniref:Branched-chain-amino-acid aminotransferase n=1 Tax=Psychrobacter cryohalolentis (strain ATCC BAA-1226 / DSM 17306 / VKM B-2378 / K5) TaxID=335284 RepID=Q1QBJ6_PSYCK|nr:MULTISPECIES: branched-chain amino acid transaminase [Psychrobacter]ABE74957.1 branched chain amino acid aminotransferase apoenzyme [Psychrobacter cryohalolentis K5]AGP48754.1 branched-chain amino acid aminotransferase [Psychrobacter sp. G]ASE25165.1 branched-chain amino acid transaminase [Psychrobacter cryohalolentis]KAA0939609.1 branched-chain amino acid transaminase [Psychrobacter sp. ANT_H59]MBA2058081.1 branched-chain amino acid transaminase [Psychrobacter sp. D2]|tara:strand:- start:2252 stop:3181 length:930 start_codon:yes stop_codon:yes gene_type:complete